LDAVAADSYVEHLWPPARAVHDLAPADEQVNREARAGGRIDRSESRSRDARRKFIISFSAAAGPAAQV
jgi:hypothetical protein